MSVKNQTTPRKVFSHSWTAEKLALQNRKSVETIRERALKHGANDLVVMCDHALASKHVPQKRPGHLKQPPRLATDVVAGYHFVCAQGRGVTEIGEGQFWSGSWVVAEANARKSIERGAYLALHEAKNEASYRHGTILNYRLSPRDMVSESETGAPPQTDEGIEFLVQETGLPYNWVGGGSGEKGYRWADQTSGDQTSVAEKE